MKPSDIFKRKRVRVATDRIRKVSGSQTVSAQNYRDLGPVIDRNITATLVDEMLKAGLIRFERTECELEGQSCVRICVSATIIQPDETRPKSDCQSCFFRERCPKTDGNDGTCPDYVNLS